MQDPEQNPESPDIGSGYWFGLLVRQGNGSSDAGHIAVGGGGVTLSGGVLNQAGVPGPEYLLGAVT